MGLAGAGPAMAAKLKVPRFVSLRFDTVNLRAGPGTQYPIDIEEPNSQGFLGHHQAPGQSKVLRAAMPQGSSMSCTPMTLARPTLISGWPMRVSA